MKLFIYENSSPVINKTLNSRTQKTDARVGLHVKVTAAVALRKKTKQTLSLSLLFSHFLQHETARLKMPLYPLNYLI